MEGVQLQERQGEHWKVMFKKLVFFYFKGGEIDTRGGPTPLNTPLRNKLIVFGYE